jgi:hypothetical protein
MQVCGASHGFQQKFVQKFVQSVRLGAALAHSKEGRGTGVVHNPDE